MGVVTSKDPDPAAPGGNTLPAGNGGSPETWFDPVRRRVLAGLAATGAATIAPWGFAQSAPVTDHGAFMALSSILTARTTLDARLAQRLHVALVADDPGFDAAAGALLTLVRERNIDPATLQSALDAEKPGLAAVARKIATAWFAGIVGSGERARVLAYEFALNAQIVADVLKPPTYCFGAYGSWAASPA